MTLIRETKPASVQPRFATVVRSTPLHVRVDDRTYGPLLSVEGSYAAGDVVLLLTVGGQPVVVGKVV